MATTTTTVSNGPDPYAYYESQGNGKGKGKGHPIVPEASSYGLFFIGIILVALISSRYLNRRVTKSL
jgi:hypothetical protein